VDQAPAAAWDRAQVPALVKATVQASEKDLAAEWAADRIAREAVCCLPDCYAR
jgi:hypothetical protein